MTTSQDVLPATITDYLVAHRAGDIDAALGCFTDDAVVVDEGRTYTGSAEIGAWLGTSSTEYTYTIELVGTERIDDEHYVATHHLKGDFPGGVVDLHFRFALRDGRVAALTIEP